MASIRPATSLQAQTLACRRRSLRLRQGRSRLGRQSLLAAWAASITILSATIWGFYFFAPLTYGSPGLDVDGVNARKWLSYDLHFAK